MARRRNSIFKRFIKLRGLPKEERSVLLKLANLMDAALNNRQASNPFEDSRNVNIPKTYPPTGLLARIGIQNIKLVWDPPNNSQHLRYEIVFLNYTTGITKTLSSYTTEVSYKAPPGDYKVTVRSVSRSGEASLVKEITFTVAEEIMQIEGAKNGPLELGTLVQDNIILRQGQSVYAWGSVVLDKYIAESTSGNHDIVFKLWRADKADALFSEAYLVQTITLYKATESSSSIGDTALGGVVIRPTGAARAGSFETSQAVMFSPITIDDVDDMKTVTFFLQAVNRTAEQDEVCLSLVLWTGDNGYGAAVPGDDWEAAPDYTLPHRNSFHAQEVTTPGKTTVWDQRSIWGHVPDGYSLIGNTYSIGVWVRFDNLSAIDLSATRNSPYGTNPSGGNFTLLSKGCMRGDGLYQINEFNVQVEGLNLGVGNYRHRVTVRAGDYLGSTQVSTTYEGVCTGSNKEVSTIFPLGDATTGSSGDAWYLILFNWSGGLFTGGVPKIRTIMAPFGQDPFLLIPSGTDGSLNPCLQDDTGHMAWNVGCQSQDGLGAQNMYEGIYNGDLRQPSMAFAQYHRMGVWNTCVDAGIGALDRLYYIFNGQGTSLPGANKVPSEYDPTATDWFDVQTDYEGINEWKNYRGNTLIHQHLFGNIERPFDTTFPCKDFGRTLWGGDINFTGVTEPYREVSGAHYHQRLIEGTYYDQTGNNWTDNTSIADILSPAGLNGTTQFGYAYPGQEGVLE